MELKIKKVKDNAKIPKIATSGAAGMDLYACITEKITVEPQKIAVIPTGIAIELPNPSVAAFVYARSGLGIKHGICLANGSCRTPASTLSWFSKIISATE